MTREGAVEFEMVTANWTTIGRLHDQGIRRAVPARTSLGTPRWLPWAHGAPFVAELAPFGLLRRPRLEREEFEALYLRRLNGIGLEPIRRRLVEVHSEYLRPLALLCFEDVRAGEFCPRRMFAEWWEQRTGQVITEL